MARKAAVKYRSLRTNLVHLPLSLYASLAQQQVRPQSLIVHLASANGRSAHLGWSGLAAASSLTSFGSGQDESLEVDPEVAMSYGWVEGELLEISLIHNPPKAASVSVTPLTVDDWEILEQHADFLEMNLLAQLRAASKDQVVDVWVKGKSKIRVKIDQTSPATTSNTSVLVNPSTEIYVAPRIRSSETQTKISSGAPLSSVAQVLDGLARSGTQEATDTPKLPSKVLRNLPMRIVKQWGLDLPAHDDALVAWCSPATFLSVSRRLCEDESLPELHVVVKKDVKTPKTEAEVAESSAAAQAERSEDKDVCLVVKPWDALPDGHIAVNSDSSGLDSLENWCRLRVTAASKTGRSPQHKAIANRKGKERATGHEAATLYAVDQPVDAGLAYLQRAQALALARTSRKSLPVRPLLVVGAKGTGRTSIALEIARRAECDPGLMTETLHVQVNRLPRDTRLSGLKERMEGWLADAKLRRPCLLVLDDLDIMLGPESELAQSSQPDIIANTFINLLGALQPTAGIYVLATALGEDSLHPSLAAKHFFGQTIKLKPLTKISRGEVLAGIVDSKMSQSKAPGPARLPNGYGKDTVDYVTLGGMTEGYSVTDLQDLVSSALQHAIMRHGQAPSDLALEMADFVQAQEGFTPLSLRDIKLQHSDIRWADIGGLHETRRVLRETLEWPTKYGPIFASCPLRLRSGLLLYGFPGCGKTLLASAVAKECGLNFISVKGPEILNKYIGASEKSVRDLFERATAAKPCVLFFDEFDSIAPKRGHDSTGVTDRVVNQMLTQMDGAEGLDGVYVLAATSRPDLIDPALLRPGRLDKSLLCDMPSVADREEILRAVSTKLDLSPDVDFAQLAQSTEGYSGADLQALVYNAHLDMVHASMLKTEMPQGKGKQKAGTAPEQPGAFVALSSTTTKTLSAAERSAMEHRLNTMLEPTMAPQLQTKIAAKRLQTIENHHLLRSLENTRPSVPIEERARLQRIYSSFVSERSGKLANGDAGRETGSRVSLM